MPDSVKKWLVRLYKMLCGGRIVIVIVHKRAHMQGADIQDHRLNTTEVYTYDSLGRLTTVRNTAGTTVAAYTYDGAGNIRHQQFGRSR